jgi:hypothetical protein
MKKWSLSQLNANFAAYLVSDENQIFSRSSLCIYHSFEDP